MSGTVNKLRFMQKAREAGTNIAPNPETLSMSLDKWELSSFEQSQVYVSPDEARKLTSISVMARRSYGGANPHIEQHMSNMEKSRKRGRQ
jgi:hypothetical protein